LAAPTPVSALKCAAGGVSGMVDVKFDNVFAMAPRSLHVSSSRVAPIRSSLFADEVSLPSA
jgi:hypothetical protein